MTNWISRLSLARKFGLLGALALLVAAVPQAMMIVEAQRAIDRDHAEIAGLEPTGRTLEWIRLAQQHRGASNVALGRPSPQADQKRQEVAAHAEQVAVEFERSVLPGLAGTALQQPGRELLQRWRDIVQSVAARRVDAPASFARHTELIDAQLAFQVQLADHYGLTLDPQASAYFLIIAQTQDMPALAEQIGQARARGALMLAQGEAGPVERGALAGIAAAARSFEQRFGTNLEKAFQSRQATRQALGDAVARARGQVDAVLSLARSRIVEAPKLDYPAAEYFQATTVAIDALYALHGQSSKELKSLLDERLAAERARQFAIALALLASTGICLGLGWAIARQTVSAAQAAQSTAARVAAGDLTGAVPGAGGDELGRMLDALRDMQSSLGRVVDQVRGNADSVAIAAAEIAQGNLDLSGRTEQQASALQQTASTMEELGSTVRANAENARQADALAREAADVAHRGGGEVAQVVGTMREIQASSRRIADIIATIDGIAFQTNILALNAAVEAARAGEQGRGFAVVAAEVRTLAQRSAAAAREIKGLIGDSVDRIEQGTALVDRAGATMQEVVDSIARVSTVVGEISTASVQQSEGVQQVGQAVQQLDQTTQQNAALVEESAAAAESLKAQAQALVQSVAVFRSERAALTL